MSNKSKGEKPDVVHEEFHQIQRVQEGRIEDPSDLDDAILRAQGHDAAVERQLNWMVALGMAFSIPNTWVGYLVGCHVREPDQSQADM